MRAMDGVVTRRPAHRQQLPQVKVKKKAKGLELSLFIPKFGRYSLRKPTHMALTLILLATIIGPTWDAMATAAKYRLSSQTQNLAADPAVRLLSQLKFDKAAQAYVIDTGSNNVSGQSAQVGGSGYKATFPANASSGISIKDDSNDLALSFTPLDSYLGAKDESGHIVYPASATSTQILYTIKANGVKEDVILQNSTGDSAVLRYRLDLPNTLEARLMPSGDLGIYSADPALFGNITFGSNADRQSIEAARTKSQKTHLAFVVPAPIIKESGHSSANPTAKFSLSGNILTVTATGLVNASYPLSIDPSFIVTSVNDFRYGNGEDNLTFDTTNNQITRATATGGSVGNWGDNTSSSYGTVNFTYGGYAYGIYPGGSATWPLGADGASFINTGSAKGINSPNLLGMPTTNAAQVDQYSIAEYNGYVYAVGGQYINNEPCGGALQPTCTYSTYNNVQYAKILSDHTLGSWQLTSAPALSHFIGGTFAYNGYLYAYQGYDPGNTDDGTTQYVKINADGTLGTWQASTSVPGSPIVEGLAEYNGYAYILGGYSGAPLNTTYVSKLSSSGFGAWNQTSSFSTGRYDFGAKAYDGYIYIAGGCSKTGTGSCGANSNSNLLSDVQYASINADGTLGQWQTTNNMVDPGGNGRFSPSLLAYNSYLYIFGGQYCNTTTNNCSTSTVGYTDMNYVPINSAGAVSQSTPTISNTVTARTGAAVVADDGYLYVIGGCTANCSSASGTFLTDTAYLKINPDGTIGNAGCGAASWCDDTTNKLPGPSNGVSSTCNGRENMTAVVFNFNIYIVGGDGLTGALCNTLSTASDVYYAFAGPYGGDIGAWSLASNTFSNGADFPGVTIYNGNLYILGGRVGSTVFSTVQSAPINIQTGNTNGSFTLTTSLPNNLYGEVSFAAKGYMYALGGATASASGAQSIGHYAKIDTNGALDINGPCGQVWCSTGTMNSARALAFGQMMNGNIYMAGGTSDFSNWLNTIEYASINDDGTLGSFTLSPATLSQGRGAEGTGGLIDGRLYAVGGCTAGGCTGFSNAVDAIQINNGGPGVNNTFTADASTIPASTSQIGGQGFIALNGYLYSVGGCLAWTTSTPQNVCTTETSVVSYAPINADGSLGTWVSSSSSPGSVSALPVAKTFTGEFAYNGYIYFYGGCSSFNTSSGGSCNDTSDEQEKFYYAKPNTDGTLTNTSTPCGSVWCVATTRTYTIVSTDALTESGGYIYGVSGGLIGVKHIPIASNGDINSSWINDTNVPAQISAYGFSVVAYDNYLYELGGYISGGSNSVAQVQYAPINRSTGAVGTWKYTSSLLHGTAEPYALAADGYVYVYAGWTLSKTGGYTSNCYGDVQVAPVLSDGSLGQFVSSGLLAGVVSSAPDLAINGSELFAANENCGTFSTDENNTVYRASYLAQPRTAHYSYLSDLATDVTPTKLAADGALASGTSNVTLTYSAASNSSPTLGKQTTSLWYPPGTPMSATPLDGSGNPFTQGRYFWEYLTIDDSGSATFPDTSSSQTSITDLMLWFHPATSTRLRNGKAFVNNNCRVSSDPTDSSGNCSLDASP